MSFDLAAHQRERIRGLERENAGLKLCLELTIWEMAELIALTYWQGKVDAMSQDEFMRELADAFPPLVGNGLPPFVENRLAVA